MDKHLSDIVSETIKKRNESFINPDYRPQYLDRETLLNLTEAAMLMGATIAYEKLMLSKIENVKIVDSNILDDSITDSERLDTSSRSSIRRLLDTLGPPQGG